MVKKNGIRSWREMHGLDVRKGMWKEACKDLRTSSLWILGKRGDDHGSNKFHGNWHPEIPRQMMLRYTQPGDRIWDPFSGSGTTLSVGKKLGREVYASDLVQRHPGCNIGDARTHVPGGLFDLVLLHPPYADIINYEAGDGDLSVPYQKFIPLLEDVVLNVHKSMQLGGILVLVISDIQSGGFIPLGTMAQNAIMGLGGLFKPIGNIVKNFGETRKNSENPGATTIEDEDSAAYPDGEGSSDFQTDEGGGIWRYRALTGGFFQFSHEYIQVYQKVSERFEHTITKKITEHNGGDKMSKSKKEAEAPKDELEWDDWDEAEGSPESGDSDSDYQDEDSDAENDGWDSEEAEQDDRTAKMNRDERIRNLFKVELDDKYKGRKFNATNMELFWTFIHERHRIWHRRFIQKMPKDKWTKDQILRENKFTNVYRELDKGTIILLDDILGRLDNGRPEIEVFFNILLYRLFNNYDCWNEGITYQEIVPKWTERKELWDRLEKRFKAGKVVFSTAHVVSGYPCFKGENKVRKMETMFNQVFDNLDDIWDKIQAAPTFKDVFIVLKGILGVGPFLAYEVAVDLTYGKSPLIRFTEDEWANAGPGAMRGSKIIFGEKANDFSAIIEYLRDNQEYFFDEYDLDFKSIAYRSKRMTLRNIEHCLCEFFKYAKVHYGAGKCRMKFSPTSTHRNAHWLERLKG